MNTVYGNGTFHWFMGVVEDRKDPEKLGRCRVRVAGHHTADKSVLPTEDLPWAMPLMPITSASVTGIGQAPIGPIEGTWVFGFFIDGEDCQIPIMMGTFPGRSEPLNLLSLLQQLAASLSAPLALSAKGLSTNALPTIDLIATKSEEETVRLNEQVTEG